MAAQLAQPEEWKTNAYRQKVVSQIEDAIQQAGSQIQKSSTDMENFVYHKAKSREEYLALVAKVILHARSFDSRRQQAGPAPNQMAPGVGPPGMPGQPGMMQGPPMNQPVMPQDPINALQNLQHNLGPSRGPMGEMQGQIPGQMPGQGSAQMARPPFQTYTGNMMPQQPRMSMGSPAMSAALHNVNVIPQGMQPVQQMGPSSAGSVGPGSNQPVPSPVSSAQLPSPAAMVPSPSVSSQSILSPAGRQYGAPSPGGALNTPGNPGSVMGGSPAVVKTEEDKAYLEKLQQLSKFIEPLKCLIREYEKDEDRKRDTIKFRNLLDILSDSNRRVHMATLLKCEQALEKHEVMKTLTTQPSATIPVVPTTKQSEKHMCQPLLDAIAHHIKSPTLNHTLKRTFGPAVEALYGLPIRPPSPPPKRIKPTADSQRKVPNPLQGEIARLGNRFHVDLDPLHHKGSKDIHLVCSIEDIHLPAVPPISLTIPENYPESSPSCETDTIVYDGTPFLQAVHKSLSEKILKLPNKYSVTHLLDTWEMSIRQACATATIK